MISFCGYLWGSWSECFTHHLPSQNHNFLRKTLPSAFPLAQAATDSPLTHK